MMDSEIATVHPRRAEYDRFDDGHGPYKLIRLSGDSASPPYWEEFKAWASDELGQGYSLACADGSILDAVTRWCYHGYRAGREHG
jgi:hypothetical protein